MQVTFGWARKRLALALTAVGAVISMTAAPAFAGAGPAPASHPARMVNAPRPVRARGHVFQGINARHSDLGGFHSSGGTSGAEDTVALGNCQGNSTGNCYGPPDPDIAAGPSELIESVNCTVASYDKTGNQTGISDIRTLFGSTDPACTDPRVIYIPWISRFALVYWQEDNVNGVLNGPMHFAVSKTANPAMSPGDWNVYTTPSGDWDQPRVLATQNTLIVAGNNTDETYFVYDLSQLASGTAQPAMQSVVGTFPYSAEAVENTPSANGYFVQEETTDTTGIHLTTISGDPVSGNVSLSVQTLSTPTFAQATNPPIPDGTLATSFDVDSATYEVQTSNNHPVIDFAGMTGCQSQLQCAYDVKLDLSGGTPQVVKDLVIQQAPVSTSFGSVGLDAAGNGFLAYSASDPNDTASANALADNDSGVLWNDQVQASTPGTSACAPTQTPPCGERWGDYFGSAQDPSNPADVWMVSEYQASSDYFGWGTAIVEANASGPISTPPPASATLSYETPNTAATSNQPAPYLQLTNTGSQPISLSDITIRYWFTEDGSQPLQFFCDYAAIGCPNISGSFASTTLGGQDHYLQLSFSAGAGSLAPGANTGIIQTRFSQTNWANMTQTNDYSFNGADTTLTANPHITVYDNGTLIYGTEP